MKKNVLVITPPTEFMVFDRFRSCLRFSAIGGTLISSIINKEKYNVDYFDIDAYMFKQFDHISSYFKSELHLMHELKYYMRGEDGERGNFFDDLTTLIDLIVPSKNYDYVLCSLPCYGNSREDCENQMRMASIIIRCLKDTKGNPITVAGGNWWENLDIEYWKRSVVDPNQIIDLLIFGSMQIDELDHLLKTGNARKAYQKNEERDPTKGYVGPSGEGELYGLTVGDWAGYYSLDPSVKSDLNNLHVIDQSNFVNRKDLRYTFKEVFEFYRVKDPIPDTSEECYIQQGSMFFMEGCIGSCAFCETGNSPLRFMYFDKLTDMIKKYVYDWGYNSLFFKNSAINPTRKFADKFCNWLIKENLNILWSDSARFHGTDQDFFDMLWESGCRSLGWGCESADDNMLKYIDKTGLTVEKMSESLKMSHEKGIWNVMNFIFGMPGETIEMVDNTVQWILEHAPFMDECHYNEYCVKPNSPFYLTPEKFGLVKEDGNVYDPERHHAFCHKRVAHGNIQRLREPHEFF